MDTLAAKIVKALNDWYEFGNCFKKADVNQMLCPIFAQILSDGSSQKKKGIILVVVFDLYRCTGFCHLFSLALADLVVAFCYHFLCIGNGCCLRAIAFYSSACNSAPYWLSELFLPNRR